MSNQESNRIRQIVGWSIVGLIAIIGVSIVLSLYFLPHPPGAFYYPFFPFHFGWLGGIFLIFIIFWVVRWLFWPWRSHYSYPHQQRADAASIVRERYAKGEITKEQFEQMIRDLRQEG
jgi:putative membrane protein